MSTTTRRVTVIGGVRTPFCRSNTLYADLSNLEAPTAGQRIRLTRIRYVSDR